MPIFRESPYGAFNFLVHLGDSDPSEVAAGFSAVHGLDQEVEVIEYRAGNDKTHARRLLPGLARPITVTLTRGVIGDPSLQQWISAVLSGGADRRNVTVQLLAEDRSVVQEWRLRQALPVKLRGPTLNAAVSAVAVEELVLMAESLSVE